ncbi:MAG: DUF3786 domain-containing protein [Chloroflexi bacterium]|nr:DUF3786 domain-containing protein [Chloroflexota bacterium]MBP7042114.1 DUF3786 domain-containing protein [Chloroflexota bacterium]
MAVEQAKTGLLRRVEELRRDLAQRDTAVLAAQSGAVLAVSRLALVVWGTAVHITLPDFVARSPATGQALDPLTQALLAYYLHTTDGAPIAGEWIAFTELANGRFYTQAFQSYTGHKLAQVFGNDVGWFEETAVALGGQAVAFAGAAFQFQVLPRVLLLVACWPGDDDFLPSYKVLFDARVNHHLPTDACAIIGSMMTGRLLTAKA